MVVLLLLAGVAPALLILWYFHASDRYPEPPRVVWTSFLLGMLSALPAGLVGAWVSFLAAGMPEIWAKGSFLAFFSAAVPEELAKFLVLYGYCRRRSEFDERMDGLVYGSAVALGFAVLENLLYIFGEGGGYAVAAFRAFTVVPMHGASGAIMGYYFALSRYVPESRSKYLGLALTVPMVIHGSYDTIVLVARARTQPDATIGWLSVALVVLLVIELGLAKHVLNREMRLQVARLGGPDLASYARSMARNRRLRGYLSIIAGLCVIGFGFAVPIGATSWMLGIFLGGRLVLAGWRRLDEGRGPFAKT